MTRVLDFLLSRILGVTIIRAEARISEARLRNALLGADRAGNHKWNGGASYE